MVVIMMMVMIMVIMIIMIMMIDNDDDDNDGYVNGDCVDCDCHLDGVIDLDYHDYDCGGSVNVLVIAHQFDASDLNDYCDYNPNVTVMNHTSHELLIICCFYSDDLGLLVSL